MNFDRMVENMKISDLDPSKKAGAAATRLDAVSEFIKFLDRKRINYINNSITEKDFIQARNQKGAWTYSPASDKEISKGQESVVGYFIEKEKLTENVLYDIYKTITEKIKVGDTALIKLEPGLAPGKAVPTKVKIIHIDGDEVTYEHQGKKYQATSNRLKVVKEDIVIKEDIENKYNKWC